MSIQIFISMTVIVVKSILLVSRILNNEDKICVGHRRFNSRNPEQHLVEITYHHGPFQPKSFYQLFIQKSSNLNLSMVNENQFLKRGPPNTGTKYLLLTR